MLVQDYWAGEGSKDIGMEECVGNKPQLPSGEFWRCLELSTALLAIVAGSQPVFNNPVCSKTIVEK